MIADEMCEPEFNWTTDPSFRSLEFTSFLVNFQRQYRSEALCSYDFIARLWYDLGPHPNARKVKARVEAGKKAVDEYLANKPQREVIITDYKSK